MKKITFVIFAVAIYTNIFASGVKETDKSVIKDESSLTLLNGKYATFLYNRFNYSAKAQNKEEMLKTLQKKICTSELKQLVDTGYKLNYVYLYKDGTIGIVIDDCNY